jgi:hypothetical protein
VIRLSTGAASASHPPLSAIIGTLSAIDRNPVRDASESAANRQVPGEECVAIDAKRGDLLPSGGRKTDYGQRRLLRVRGEWPRDCRAKCSEKVPPHHARPHAQVAAS